MDCLREEYVYVKLDSLTESQLHSITEQLTDYPKMADDDQEPVKSFTLDKEGYIGVPHVWGMDRFDYLDMTSGGSEIDVDRLPDPNHENAPDGQEAFTLELLDTMYEYEVMLAQADTGCGKTVSALSVIGQMGLTSLVIVPSVKLAHQWVKEAKRHLGLTDDDLAIIQGDKCDYKGKKICIGIINSLATRDYGEDFRNYFGITVWDEVHRVAAKTFSLSMGATRSQYRLGLTATPERRDGLMKVVHYHIGEPIVISSAEAMPLKVCVHDSDAFRYYKRGEDGEEFDASKDMPRAILLNMMAKCKRRNAEIVKILKYAYDNDRNILVIGDRVEQLQILIQRCEEAGIPAEKMGLFTRSMYTGEKYKDGKKKGKKKTVTIGEDELNRVAKDCQLIFSTFTMMKEGVDIPHLDFGIDVTPRSEAIQVVGRIRRLLTGKKKPVWVTIKDVVCKEFAGSYHARMKDYRKVNADIRPFPKLK